MLKTKPTHWKKAKLPFKQAGGRAKPISEPESRLLKEMNALAGASANVKKDVPKEFQRLAASIKSLSRPYAVALQFGQFWGPCAQKVRRGKPKLCFSNSMDAALNDSSLTYVEGYAISTGVPFSVEHGWCVDKAGVVYDATWREAGVAYFGIAFQRRTLMRIWLEMAEEGWITPILPRMAQFFPNVAW